MCPSYPTGEYKSIDDTKQRNRVKIVLLDRLPRSDCVRLLYILCALSSLLAALACVVMPPGAAPEAAGEPIPRSARCLRAERKANYVRIEVSIGTPSRIISVLFRPDVIVPKGPSALRIFNSRTVESLTLQCTDAESGPVQACNDTVLFSRGSNAGFHVFIADFEYINYAYASGVAKYPLQLDGEMHAMQGTRYWITSTHVCFEEEPQPSPSGTEGALLASAVSLDDGRYSLVTTVASVRNMEEALFYESPLHTVYDDGVCPAYIDAHSSVHLFPVAASHESSYLSLSDTLLYEVEPTAVIQRRAVAELGHLCAGDIAALKRARHLYVMDCVSTELGGSCNDRPALPWRRVGRNAMRIHYPDSSDVAVYIWMEPDAVLGAKPEFYKMSESVVIGVAKLALITLVAATIWIRARRATSKGHHIYMNCAARSSDKTTSVHKAEHLESIIEDATLGLACAVARLVVVSWRCDVLIDDRQQRIVSVEFAAAAASLLHWSCRQLFIRPNIWQQFSNDASDSDNPLLRLGGSSAVVDSAMAVMIAYAGPPLLVSDGGFDTTARLLVGVLLSIVSLQRCMYSNACCTLEILSRAGVKKQPDPIVCSNEYVQDLVFSSMLVGALSFWLLQAVCIGIALADLVATPMAVSLTRAQVGERAPISAAIATALLALGAKELFNEAVQLCKVHVALLQEDEKANRSRRGASEVQAVVLAVGLAGLSKQAPFSVKSAKGP